MYDLRIDLQEVISVSYERITSSSYSENVGDKFLRNTGNTNKAAYRHKPDDDNQQNHRRGNIVVLLGYDCVQ
jgi:hypothetical protein